ncbi:PAS domain-containing protein [bacterium]|nr:PAS domain-containing protein [bacterium]
MSLGLKSDAERQSILKAFKDKSKDKAEFWFQMNSRFIHIRYFPIYDDHGVYKGVIEVSQDVTDIRGLEGDRKLMDW